MVDGRAIVERYEHHLLAGALGPDPALDTDVCPYSASS